MNNQKENFEKMMQSQKDDLNNKMEKYLELVKCLCFCCAYAQIYLKLQHS